jgi:hypothetical protein
MDAETRLEGEMAEGDPEDAQSRPEVPYDGDHDVRQAESNAPSDEKSKDDRTSGNEDALQEPASWTGQAPDEPVPSPPVTRK